MNHKEQIIDNFLFLVRLGTGKSNDKSIVFPENTNEISWGNVQELAKKQGVDAVVLDGVECLPENKRPSKEHLLEWIGEVLQGYEYRYEMYKRSISELAVFYNANGYKMMVLKGFACSLDWPKPEHRPCGDIDIWLFGKQKEADKTLSKAKKIIIDDSLHHTVFYWGDFMVENHYDFINTKRHRTHLGLELVFKELGQDDSHFVELNDDASTGSAAKVYLPSPNLHALFLMRHALNHFASSCVTLRQVLDWAFFVEKHTKEIDWDWYLGTLEKYHMKEFFNCLNAICVEDLGFESSIFHSFQFNPLLKEKVLKDILEPDFEMAEPKHFLLRLRYKYSRWKGTAWKQKLCYPKESRLGGFWSGIYNLLRKPSSI